MCNLEILAVHIKFYGNKLVAISDPEHVFIMHENVVKKLLHKCSTCTSPSNIATCIYKTVNYVNHSKRFKESRAIFCNLFFAPKSLDL